jgi:hypothetical protein
VCNEKCQINSFYNSLKSATDSTVLKQIGFAYYTDDEFNSNLSNSSATRIDLSVFHLNIRSLNKNREELYSLLYSLDIEFDVIILSEVWNCNLELYHNVFKGYTFHYDTPTLSRVGGVGVFVKNCYSCHVISSLKIENSVDVNVENVWIEISKKGCKYIVGAVYRHPNHSFNEFGSILDNKLSDIAKLGTPCVVAGDFNIDISKYGLHSPTTDYVNLLLSNNFLPVVVMPTRINDSTSSIIDHMYYFEGNNCKKTLEVKSGNIWSDITDHLPNFMLISEKPFKKPNI